MRRQRWNKGQTTVNSIDKLGQWSNSMLPTFGHLKKTGSHVLRLLNTKYTDISRSERQVENL